MISPSHGARNLCNIGVLSQFYLRIYQLYLCTLYIFINKYYHNKLFQIDKLYIFTPMCYAIFFLIRLSGNPLRVCYCLWESSTKNFLEILLSLYLRLSNKQQATYIFVVLHMLCDLVSLAPD